MSPLRDRLETYLALRRALGFKLVRAARLLPDFVAYVERHPGPSLTTALALAWAQQPPAGPPAWWAQRLSTVRSFARYLQAFDARTEVPPPSLIPAPRRRAIPYLYSDQELARLMAAARQLHPRLRAATYTTLIGLLATTGMRVGEAIRLDGQDVAWGPRVLIVRDSKFGKSRELPLHASTAAALRAYTGLRDRHRRAPAPSFFCSTAGTRLVSQNVHHTFLDLVRRAGLPPRPTGGRPRPHDLRHTFAVRTVLGWYQAGLDVEAPPPTLVDVPRPRGAQLHLLVPVGDARADGAGGPAARTRHRGAAMSALAPLLEAFFTTRLQQQRHASPHTVAAYRDTFRLLLRFVLQHRGQAPATLDLGALDAPLIGTFLEPLETTRHNQVRTRNARLAAIHAFFRYAAYQAPDHSALIQRVLAIPTKRSTRAGVTFLTEPEIHALLAAPDCRSWIGRRDHAFLCLAVQTGLRVSELTPLRVHDLELGHGPHVRCQGKGRKERCTPLTAPTVAVLRAWLRERHAQPTDLLFPSRRGSPLSRDAVERLVGKYGTRVRGRGPSSRRHAISPHVLRHTSAMQLLQAGVDCSVIALWLGHESVETTQMYLHADLAIKERALARTAPLPAGPARYRAPDALLAFLEGL